MSYHASLRCLRLVRRLQCFGLPAMTSSATRRSQRSMLVVKLQRLQCRGRKAELKLHSIGSRLTSTLAPPLASAPAQHRLAKRRPRLSLESARFQWEVPSSRGHRKRPSTLPSPRSGSVATSPTSPIPRHRILTPRRVRASLKPTMLSMELFVCGKEISRTWRWMRSRTPPTRASSQAVESAGAFTRAQGLSSRRRAFATLS